MPAVAGDERRKLAFASIATAAAALLVGAGEALRTSAPLIVVLVLVPLAASTSSLAWISRDSDLRRYALAAVVSFAFAVLIGLASLAFVDNALAPRSMLARDYGFPDEGTFQPAALALFGFTATRGVGIILVAFAASGIRRSGGDEAGLRLRLAVAFAVGTIAGALLFAAAPSTFSGWASASFRGTLGQSSFGGFVDALAVREKLDLVDGAFMAAPAVLLGLGLASRGLALFRPPPPPFEPASAHRVARARVAAVSTCLISLALFGFVLACVAMLSSRTTSSIQGLLTQVQAAVVTTLAMLFATARRDEPRTFAALAIIAVSSAAVLGAIFLADVWIALGREKEGLSIFLSPLSANKSLRVVVLALWFVGCAGVSVACAIVARSPLVRDVTHRLGTLLWVSAIACAASVLAFFVALASATRSAYGLFALVAGVAAVIAIVASASLGWRARHLT